MSKPTLLYFPAPGRAFVCRICLFAAFGKDGWVNDMINFDEFSAEKKKIAAGEPSRLFSGSLPQLTLPDGKTYGQSAAIVRYALAEAREAGDKALFKLYPETPEDTLLAEEASEYALEVLNNCPHDKDEDIKKAKREEYAAGNMKKWMGILEKRLGERDGPFLLGGNPCVGDFVLMGVSGMILAGQFDYVLPEYLDQFPKIKAHAEAVGESEPVKAYKEAYGEKGGV